MCAPFCIHQKRDRPYFYGGMDLDVVLKIPWDFIPAAMPAAALAYRAV